MAVQSAAESAAALANIEEKLAANDLAASRLSNNNNSNSKIMTNDMRIAEEKSFIRDVCRGFVVVVVQLLFSYCYSCFFSFFYYYYSCYCFNF